MPDGAQLLAEGEPISLNNGRKVHLRYSMTSMLWMERNRYLETEAPLVPPLPAATVKKLPPVVAAHLEQLQTVVDQLRVEIRHRDGGIGDFETGLGMLAGGLLHDNDGQGKPLTVDHLAELINPSDFEEVMERARVAVAQAFPTMAATPQDEENQSLSPGTSGITSPPSSSSEHMTSSGT